MKSLIDLRTGQNTDIDSRSLFDRSELDVSQENSTKQLEDFSPKRDFFFFSEYIPLSLEKNTTRFFDALTKKTSRIFGLKEPLVIKQDSVQRIYRKSYFSFPKIKRQTSGKIIGETNIPFFFRLTPILGVCLIIFSLIWLDKIFVENRVLSGYQKILNLKGEPGNLKDITENINDARFDFLLADIFFTPFRLLPFQDIDNAKNAISGGKYLTKTLDRILGMYHETEQFVHQKDIENIYFTQLLENIAPEFQDIESYLSSSLGHYEDIKGISDPRISSEIEKTRVLLREMLGTLTLLNTDYKNLLSFLGHNEKRKYLIVFQNADEIRPTGGFMGSMGVLEIFRGKVQNFEMRDVYSFEWDLKKSPYKRLPAPPGIDTLTDTFGLRDANYFINIRDSSENIRFFVENSGQDIDGVIYVNQNVLLDFLELTGGIYFEPVGRIIDEKNFSEIMSLLVEAKLFKVGTLGTPKQVLFDFVDVYQGLLFEKKKYFEYLQILGLHIKNRDIMAQSFYPSETELLQGVGLGGKIDYDKTLDFSYPVFTSLSGNKSDRYMERIYTKEIEQKKDCSVETTLQIGQRHTFSSTKEKEISEDILDFQIQNKNTLSIQGKGKNKQFIRVLIPHKAELSLSEGMNVVDYGSRKAVEFYTTVEAGERINSSFSYTLKNSSCQPYTFGFYKQPGIRQYELHIKTVESKEVFSGLKGDFFYASKK